MIKTSRKKTAIRRFIVDLIGFNVCDKNMRLQFITNWAGKTLSPIAVSFTQKIYATNFNIICTLWLVQLLSLASSLSSNTCSLGCTPSKLSAMARTISNTFSLSALNK